ncbi:MAG: hypothetical protein KDA28_16970, partial [Phycisphaerales bacterium]|nr:hypothetical protein [Phycisphaerales bacterium]
MRILICNPDTIGDVVLRQPMFEALRDAGHDLALVVRPLVEPLVKTLAPGAHVIPMDVQPYRADFVCQGEAHERICDAVQAFDPEVLIVAPYQWTLLEEHLTRLCDDARVYAFSGYVFGDPRHGPRPRSRLRVDHVVDVEESSSEARKNEAMTSAVLGRAVDLPWPSIEAPREAVDAASGVASTLGLSTWDVACVGESPSTEVRNWPLERWAELLEAHARRSDRHVLLIGASIEQAS